MENTPYSVVCDLFLDKIKEDTDYFKYDGLSDEETLEIINLRTLDLMRRSANTLQSEISPKHGVDFTDRDDNFEEFNWELNKIEIDLLSEKMVSDNYNSKKLKLSKFNTYLGSGTMKVFSPSEERKSYLQLVEHIDNNYSDLFDNYDDRVRGVGGYIY